MGIGACRAWEEVMNKLRRMDGELYGDVRGFGWMDGRSCANPKPLNYLNICCVGILDYTWESG